MLNYIGFEITLVDFILRADLVRDTKYLYDILLYY